MTSDDEPTPPHDPTSFARILAAVALVLVLGLWLWPLQYAFVDGECGADIGIGLYAFFVATPATILALVTTTRHRRDRVVLALGFVTLLLAIPTVLGLWVGGGDGGIPPWDQWITFAVDRWYGDC